MGIDSFSHFSSVRKTLRHLWHISVCFIFISIPQGKSHWNSHKVFQLLSEILSSQIRCCLVTIPYCLHHDPDADTKLSHITASFTIFIIETFSPLCTVLSFTFRSPYIIYTSVYIKRTHKTVTSIWPLFLQPGTGGGENRSFSWVLSTSLLPSAPEWPGFHWHRV